MKSFREYNYYEILDIPVKAADSEIRQAYKDMLFIYNEESSATYSLFTNEEREQILDKIETAFSTLIDKHTRAVYDATLIQSGEIDKFERKGSEQGADSHNLSPADIKKRNLREKIKEDEHKEALDFILSKEIISGRDIRTFREKIGIELHEVYEATRINIPVLKNIEEDNIEKLPSGIYVKYLLRQYTDFLGIDSGKLIDAYMNNLNRTE